jgi:VWFA-related protein
MLKHLLVVVATLASAPAAFQTPVGQGPSQGPIFRVATEHVGLDVVVTDDRGAPIRDLSKADFVIREAGRVQTIEDFAFVEIPPGSRAVSLDVKLAPPPDVSANTALRTSRAFAIVVDDGAISSAFIVQTKRVMTELLSTLSPDDQVAVTYIRRSDLGQDFTSDLGRLARAVNRFTIAVGWRPDEGASRLVLENVVGTLATAPQSRKAIFYLSTGFPARVPDERWLELFGRARRVDVPIYTIDPQGLGMPDDAGLGGHIEDQTPETREAGADKITAKQDFMVYLAGETGGRAFLSGDARRVAEQVVSDNGAYYLLGYYPDPLVSDGRFHDVVVDVNRPGAHVRARRGYVAPPPARAPMTAREATDAAMARGLDTAGLELRAFAAPVVRAGKGMTTVVLVDVTYPADGVSAGRFQDELEFGALALDSDAKVKAEAHHLVAFSTTESAGRPVGTRTFSIVEALALPAGTLTLRIGVTSRALGRTGVTHMPLTVPRLDRADLLATGPLIGQLDEAPSPLIGGEGVRKVLPFRPTTVRRFAPGATLEVYAPLFWKGQDTKPTVRLLVRHDTDVVLRQQLTVEASGRPEGLRTAAARARVRLAGLRPGRYELVLEATLGNRRTAREVPFDVIEPAQADDHTLATPPSGALTCCIDSMTPRSAFRALATPPARALTCCAMW